MSFVLLLKQLELSMFLSVCFAKPSSFPRCLFHLFHGKFLVLLCAAFILFTVDFACRAELFPVSVLCFESTKR